jgi:hypothetical protein
MKEKLYIKQLEDRMHDLISMLTDHNLYGFLSDKERKKLGEVLQKACEARNQYKTA